jgi:hypothetical protein
MSEREKKLVTLFGIAGLILLIFWGYSFYQNKSNALKQDRIKAENNLRDGKLYLASRDAILDEIDWLAKNEPEPQAVELVAPKLQEFANSQAMSSGLTVKKQDPLDDRSIESTEQNRYKVAQVKFQVTGDERALYLWFDRMHSPNDFRVISEITLLPNRDDSKIDATVTFDQWFVPLPPSV